MTADRLTPEEKEALDALVEWRRPGPGRIVLSGKRCRRAADALIASRKPKPRFVADVAYVYDTAAGPIGSETFVASFSTVEGADDPAEAARYAAWRNERAERGEM